MSKRRGWQEQIIAGTDRWALLLIWFQNHKERLKAEIEPLAAATPEKPATPCRWTPCRTRSPRCSRTRPTRNPPPHLYYSYNITKNTQPGTEPGVAQPGHR